MSARGTGRPARAERAARLSRRTFLKAGGMLVVGTGLGAVGLRGAGPGEAQTLPGADRFLGKTLAADQVDAFLAVHADGSVTVFSGKVDIGTGARAAMRQMVAEELDIPFSRIHLIEGDTALTPDQGSTSGSYGIARGGVQLRQAAATARQGLLALAAQRLGLPAADLEVVDGVVRPRAGGAGVSYAELVGDRALGLKLDPKAPLKDPRGYRLVGHPVPRPDVPAKVTGRHRYVQDLVLPGMLHARVIRPAAVGARLDSVSEASIASIPGAKVVRRGSFLAVVAEREWDAVRAARQLSATWSGGGSLPDQATLFEAMQAAPVLRDQVVAQRGDLGALAGTASGVRAIAATYRWPIQTHGSIGPSCAVADVRGDRATIWTPSQATHRYRPAFAAILGLPADKVRVIYLDGAGSYGQNGYEDAACDAALVSQVVGRPVRVQWMRGDEHGWDPKGPPQLLALRGAVDAQGEVAAWETRARLPVSTQGLPSIPLLGADSAGIAQPAGRATGLIHQNIDPPYRYPNVSAVVHWIADTPLRTSPIRAPGKVANTFAVESFVDELAALAGVDSLEFRTRRLDDPRGLEVLRRAAAALGWSPRPSPRPRDPAAAVLTGRGLAYVHYKHDETYVAAAMEVAVERATGRIRVTRVACAQDCGLMINPDCVRSQVEGNVLQTVSRTLYEEVTFDRDRVTSLDWAAYPILTFADAPAVLVDLVQRVDQPPMGTGEAAAAPIPAALGNAVFDATGVRLRTVPFRPADLKAALDRA